MKKVETLVIFVCDCCGERSLEGWSKMLQGCNYGSSGVSYEPKVMGDYCVNSLFIILFLFLIFNVL